MWDRFKEIIAMAIRLSAKFSWRRKMLFGVQKCIDNSCAFFPSIIFIQTIFMADNVYAIHCQLSFHNLKGTYQYNLIMGKQQDAHALIWPTNALFPLYS